MIYNGGVNDDLFTPFLYLKTKFKYIEYAIGYSQNITQRL